METQTVALTLGGETRQIEVQRYSPNHAWFTTVPVLVRFRTGNKVHRLLHAQVVERGGLWHFVWDRLYNKPVYPVAWADDHEGSGWNRG